MKKYLFVLVLIVAAASGALYFYQQSKSGETTAASSEAEVAALVSAVGKLIVLPEGEAPTVATVSDPEKLKGQVFFANAKKGDKVLLYANARKAIMYSPDQNKIVEVAPLTNEPAPQNPSPGSIKSN